MAIELESWSNFAVRAQSMHAPLYAQLASAIDMDLEIAALTDGRKSGQPRINLLFGAVHFLLLRGEVHELRSFYRTLGGEAAASTEAYPVFRDFCLKQRDAIVSLVDSRVTNTNEIGRSAILHAGFRALAAMAPEPFNLIEVGPSAGLNLNWHRYGVRYVKDGEALPIRGAGDLIVDAAWRGATAPPDGPTPQVKKTIGLERDLVDLSKADDRDWLKALVWSDHVERFQRLDKAIALASDHPPTIWKGDALDLLVPALRSMPEGETLCLFHTVTLYQFTEEMRETLSALLTMAGLRRPVFRLSMEVEEVLSGVARLKLYRYHDGTVEERLLALCNSHGSWIEWQG